MKEDFDCPDGVVNAIMGLGVEMTEKQRGISWAYVNWYAEKRWEQGYKACQEDHG